MNLFKKFIFYSTYRTLVKQHTAQLAERFDIRVDNIYRMYTVIHVPDDTTLYGPQNAQRLAGNWLKNWLATLDQFLVEIELKELTAVEKISQLDPQNFLLVIRYKYLNIANWMYAVYSVAAIVAVSVVVIIILKLI